ncbi:hypothetical protein HPB52_002674 [Rhipicephalus sanguineus]|uniref:Regulatory protein zeste n=1 Tax=Rhipicephalus sanguineus TaxID=34632 RepID=A0A9D4T8C6_RHISA|nr:hypothetical protein HPB52_002674 [Rhipicephalus sanguineus]
MAEGASTSGTRGPRVPEGQREIVLAFMEEHPQLVSRAVELGPHFTVADRRRLWQQLAEALNAEGPAQKSRYVARVVAESSTRRPPRRCRCRGSAKTLHRIELSTTRLAIAAERTAAAQEGTLRELRHLAEALREREN